MPQVELCIGNILDDLDPEVLKIVDVSTFQKRHSPVFAIDEIYSLTSMVERNLQMLTSESVLMAENIVKNHRGFSGELSNVQRALFNAVNSQQQFMDLIKHSFSKNKKGASDALKSIDKYTNLLFDNEPGYKILMSLRNYAQHKSIPPMCLKKSGSSLHLMLRKEVLAEDKKTHKKLRLEMKSDHEFDALGLAENLSTNLRSFFNYSLYKLAQAFRDELALYSEDIGHDYIMGESQLFMRERKNDCFYCYHLPKQSLIRVTEIVEDTAVERLVSTIDNRLNEKPFDINDYPPEAHEGIKKIREFAQPDSLSVSAINNWLSEGRQDIE